MVVTGSTLNFKGGWWDEPSTAARVGELKNWRFHGLLFLGGGWHGSLLRSSSFRMYMLDMVYRYIPLYGTNLSPRWWFLEGVCDYLARSLGKWSNLSSTYASNWLKPPPEISFGRPITSWKHDMSCCFAPLTTAIGLFRVVMFQISSEWYTYICTHIYTKPI